MKVRPTSRPLREPVSGEVSISEEQAAMLNESAFLWFLQWYAPGVTLSRAMVTQGKRAGQAFVTLIDAKQETLLQLYQGDGRWSGQQHGGTGLWELVERAHGEWNSLGRPELSAYGVVWEKQQGRFALVLPQPGVVFPL
jgi:hypothetical protein